MQLNVLRESITAFSRDLNAGWASGLEPLYETVAHWQAAWPPATPADLAPTLDAALANQQTRAFWQGHAYFPKESLLTLATYAPEMVNMAFGRLFNASEELAARYSGFVFYLDEVLEEYRRHQPIRSRGMITHHHADYRAPSLYCACRFPATEAYFESEVYLRSLRILKAPNVGSVADASRFAKSVKVVWTFLQKDETFVKTQIARFAETHRNPLHVASYRGDCALVVSEFFRWLGR